MSQKNNKIYQKGMILAGKLLVLVLLMALIVPSASALSSGKVNIEKMPLEPGDTVDIWIEVRNDGMDTLQNVVLTLQQSGEARGSIGILDGSAGLGNLDPRERVKARFTVYAAPDATDGIYNFEINYKYAITSGNDTDVMGPLTTFTLQIVGEPPYLIISETSDNIISPGTTKHITVTIRNVGDDPAKDIFLEINPIPDTEGDGSSETPDMSDLSGLLGSSIPTTIPGMPSLMGGGEENPPPFVVTGSGNRFFVGDLSPGISRDITFKLTADSGAKQGAYNLPITIHRRNGQSTSEYIGIMVTSRAELNVPDIRTDPKDMKATESGILMVTVENVGKNDARSVRVDLSDNEYIKGTISDYVGTVSPDEDDTALFEITVLEGSPEVIPVTFKVSYQDETGEYSFIEKGFVTVDKSLTEETTSENGYLAIPVVGVILAVLISVMVIYYRSKQNNDSFEDEE